MNQDNLPDLDWFAFRYLANELGESERLAFEDQLAEDQTAREAVARAVELTQVLSAARELDEIVLRSTDSPAVSCAVAHRAAWSSPLAWMSVGAAACLVLVACVSFGLNLSTVGNALRGVPPISPGVPDLELAHAWSHAREESAGEDESWWNDLLAQFQHARSDVPRGGLVEDDASEEVAGVPTWMQSAVSREFEPEGDHETREN